MSKSIKATPARMKRPKRQKNNHYSRLDCGCKVPRSTQGLMYGICLCCWRCILHATVWHNRAAYRRHWAAYWAEFDRKYGPEQLGA